MWSAAVMDYELYFIFYNFLIYSFFGWIYESLLVSVQKKKWVNRGFLNGPLIPLYGAGATLIYMFLSPLRESAVLIFLGGMLLASLLEFSTSYVMEKLFHAKWWDYSNMKFNLQGRICLLASLFWGFLSILVTEVIQPLVSRLIEGVPRAAAEIAAYAILALFLADLAATVVSAIQLDKVLSGMQLVREELGNYIEGTRLYEATEEWRSKLEHKGMPEWISVFREALEERIETREAGAEQKESRNKPELLEEIEARIKKYSERYQISLKGRGIIQKRLLRAFPDLKFKNKEQSFEDLKKRLFDRIGKN